MKSEWSGQLEKLIRKYRLRSIFFQNLRQLFRLLLIPLLYLMNALCGVQGIAAAHLIADVGAAAISAGILLHWLRALVEKTAEV